MMINTVCKNIKCAKGRCQRKAHDGCPTEKCVRVASHGPIGTKDRLYCGPCLKQLVKVSKIIKSDYEITNKKCGTPDCKGPSNYRVRGTTSCTHCAVCAKLFDPPLVADGVKYCEHVMEDKKLCPKQSKFVVNNTNYCKEHSVQADQDGTKTVSTKSKCIVCNKVEPTFGLNSAESTKPTHCKKCAGDLGKDIRHKQCEECIRLKIDNPKRPTFGVESAKPTHCKLHKTDAMFDVSNPMCEICKKVRPSWKHGPTGSITRCQACIPSNDPSWISINEKKPKVEPKVSGGTSKKKQADYCPRCPDDNQKAKMYGLPGGSKQFCFDHKDDGMINVISARCDYDLGADENEEKGTTVSEGRSAEPRVCGKIAQFGVDKPTRCMEHKNDMKRLVGGCKEPNCDTNRASYGIRNRETNKNGKPTHCAEHKKDEMVDISHRLCKYKKDDLFICDIRASYPETEDGPEVFCKLHNINNTTDVTHKKCSELLDEGIRCVTRASYGFLKGNGQTGRAEKCYHCKKDKMVNVVERRCVKCHYGSQGQTPTNRNRQDGKCYRCWRDSDDNNKLLAAKFAQKEQIIVKSLKENDKLKHVSFECDKAVGGGSLRRPDILIRCDSHNVVVEIDENQHNHSSYNDEDVRIIEILYALKSVPLVVIRFNPDSYKEPPKTYRGLFTAEGNIIRIARTNLYNEAIEQLVKAIDVAINLTPTETLSIQYLRYTPKKI